MLEFDFVVMIHRTLFPDVFPAEKSDYFTFSFFIYIVF
mgnify:CR=1 FL=1